MSSPDLVPPELDKPKSPDVSPRPAPPRAKRPAWARAIVVVAALGMLYWAGTTIVGQVREVWPAAAPPQAFVPGDGRGRRVDGTQAVEVARRAHHSRVVIGKVGGRTFVSLGKNKFLPEMREEGRPLLLETELFRQAFLIAARDGLGAGIRDEMLGEAPAPAAEVPGLEIRYRFEATRSAEFTILRDGEGNKLVWGRNFAASPSTPPLITTLVEVLEKFSRTDLPKALSEAGVAASRAVARPDARLPETVEADLGRMSFPSQFSAVRALHEAIRADGETPERIAALARGYANLGVLTEHHWNASHKAYEARALLYAERLHALRPDALESLWVRAYARGLVGLHRFAIEDLEQASVKARTIAEASRPTPPDWVTLADQLCRFNTKGLLDACKDPGRASLAAVFAVKTVEQSKAYARAVEVVRTAQEACPDNLWIIDASSRIPMLSHLHVATVQGLALFGFVVPRDLARVAGLPDDVEKLLGGKPSPSGEVAIATALAEAGTHDRDPGEPSWSALAKFVREARFAQVARRVEFMATKWSVPVDDFLEQVKSVAGEHPLWPVLEVYGMGDDPLDRPNVISKIQSIPSEEFEGTETLLYQTLQQIDAGLGTSSFSTSLRHCDFVERDQAYLVRSTRAGDVHNAARALADISPYSPIGAARLLQLVPAEFDEARLAELRSRHDQHPEFLAALGAHFVRANKPDEAVKVLNAAIELSPDRATYRELAELHKAAGRMEEWKETLDAFLLVDDPGLQHAQVQVELAQYFMDRKDWDQAIPYAEAAAQTWAAWAMICASRCYAGKKDWEKAEFWARNLSERYDNMRGYWFEFCVQTGVGDVVAAGDLMADRILDAGDSATLNDLTWLGIYFILIKEPRRAIDSLERALPLFKEDEEETRVLKAMTPIRIAMLADGLDDGATRDRMLEQVAGMKGEKVETAARFARVFLDAVKVPAGTPIELAPIEALFAEMDQESRIRFGYYAARFLEHHGRTQEALKYFGYSLSDPASTNITRFLSRMALRDRKIEVGPDGSL